MEPDICHRPLVPPAAIQREGNAVDKNRDDVVYVFFKIRIQLLEDIKDFRQTIISNWYAKKIGAKMKGENDSS